MQVLDGQEVKLWGYVSHSNLYGDGGPDVLAAFQKDSTNTPFWLSWLSNVAALPVANGITLLITFFGLRRSGRWERTVMVEQLLI